MTFRLFQSKIGKFLEVMLSKLMLLTEMATLNLKIERELIEKEKYDVCFYL